MEHFSSNKKGRKENGEKEDQKKGIYQEEIHSKEKGRCECCHHGGVRADAEQNPKARSEIPISVAERHAQRAPWYPQTYRKRKNGAKATATAESGSCEVAEKARQGLSLVEKNPYTSLGNPIIFPMNNSY